MRHAQQRHMWQKNKMNCVKSRRSTTRYGEEKGERGRVRGRVLTINWSRLREHAMHYREKWKMILATMKALLKNEGVGNVVTLFLA
jgi:hypothetical protein